MIAGDLGRFGSGGPYEEYSQFYVRTDLRKAQQNTGNYGKVSTRTKAHSNGKQEV